MGWEYLGYYAEEISFLVQYKNIFLTVNLEIERAVLWLDFHVILVGIVNAVIL